MLIKTMMIKMVMMEMIVILIMMKKQGTVFFLPLNFCELWI